MSVRFTENTDKILIVYDRNAHSRRDFLNFVFKQRRDWQPLHMKISTQRLMTSNCALDMIFTQPERGGDEKPILI